MKDQLTEAEFYKLKFLRSQEALASEKKESSLRATRLLGAIGFMATMAGDTIKGSEDAIEMAERSAKTEIKDFLFECGVSRKAAGDIQQWGIEVGSSHETSFFKADEENTEPQDEGDAG